MNVALDREVYLLNKVMLIAALSSAGAHAQVVPLLQMVSQVFADGIVWSIWQTLSIYLLNHSSFTMKKVYVILTIGSVRHSLPKSGFFFVSYYWRYMLSW